MTTLQSRVSEGTHRLAVVAFIVDIAMFVVFAALGRASHDEGHAITGTLTVAAPFVIAYVVMAAIARLQRDPLSVRRAAAVWFPTVVLGMVLRRLVFDRGTAPAFVVVAFITTAVLLLGWRALVHIVRTARAA